MDGELTVVEQSTTHNSLDLIKTNDVLERENSQATLVVQQVLHNKQNPVMIKNKKTGEEKRHLEFEDWIALGNAYGITVKTRAEPAEVFEAKGFKGFATVVRVFDGVEIGGAEAYCLDNEKNWLNRDYFQMSSMAQTRAGSKALSNALRGVVALDKTINGTPAEEMGGIGESQSEPKPEPKPSEPTAPKPKEDKAPVPKAPSIDDEAIEVKAEVVQNPKEEIKEKPQTLKDIMDSNKHIRNAVNELQAVERPVSRDSIKDKLMDFLDGGKVTEEEYFKAKTLLE